MWKAINVNSNSIVIFNYPIFLYLEIEKGVIALLLLAYDCQSYTIYLDKIWKNGTNAQHIRLSKTNKNPYPNFFEF